MDPNREEKGGIHIEILAMVHKFPRVVEQLSEANNEIKENATGRKPATKARKPETAKLIYTEMHKKAGPGSENLAKIVL